MTNPSQNKRLSAQDSFTKRVGKLHPRSPVRLWLTRHPEREEGSAEELCQALEYTHFCDGVDHAVAYRILSEMLLSPQERLKAKSLCLAALTQPVMYKDTLRRIRRSLSLDRTALGWSVLGWVALLLLCAALSSVPFLILTLLSLITVTTYRFWHQGHLARQSAAAALARVGDPTCIVILSQHQCPSLRSEVRPTLKALLPTVTEEWYGHLPFGTNDALVSLAESGDVEFALAALDALQRAGDGSSAKAVEHLALHSDSPPVRDQAAAILPTLIARRAQEESAASLLRPSAADPREPLLRPVYGSDPTITHLLRAANAESPPPAASLENAHR